MQIEVLDRDHPFDPPPFEGEPEDAHQQLIDGAYRATDEDGLEGTLVVHGGRSYFEYDRCGMMGCPVADPHNHTEQALL